MKFIKDPKSNIQSATLTFAVASFILSIVSIILSHKFLNSIPATILSILLFTLCMFFYRLRRIDEFSVNLKTGEVSAKDLPDQKS